MSIIPKFTAAAIQMNSGDSPAANLARAAALIAEAARRKARLAVLPEFFPSLTGDEKAKFSIAEEDSDGPIQTFLSETAAKHRLYLQGGTLPITAPPAADGTPRTFAAAMLYAPDGSRLLRYDKIHLFEFVGKHQTVDESRTIAHGGTKVTPSVTTPLGRIGVAVCYDLRFPEIFRKMKNPDLIAAPSAFLPETGQAHWELLLRARAVENLAFVIGAAQAGEHPGKRRTHGHSMIVNPWGEILAAADGEGEQVICATIEAAQRDNFRRRLPVLNNRRMR